MNAHQRRVARRLYERAFGNHVDYVMTVRVNKPVEPDDDDSEYCQSCGAMLEEDAEPYSYDVVCRPYVTASGDLYCDVCGRAMDEAEEAMYDEEDDGIDWNYMEWEDIATGETGGRYIGEGSEYPTDGTEGEASR